MMIAFLLISIAYIGFNNGAVQTKEQQLLERLLLGYNKLVRPVTNISYSVDATFGIELIQLVKVDDRNQLITTKIWVRQSWTNMLMKWNSSEWDNIGQLKVDASDVWVPDIILYDNAASEYAGGTEKYKTQITLYPNGSHYWLSPAVFTTTCRFNIKFFPFDQQTCIMKFGSWTYDIAGINLEADDRPPITSQYINSTEWDVRKVETIRNVLKYGCCPQPFVDVAFIITLERKPLFYLFNVILPCLVLALTISFGFFFPPESGERISLTITILLAIAVFMQMISATLPVNSDGVPNLALFYMVILVESASSLITTCVVLIIHHRSGDTGIYPMPKWVRKYFIQILGRKLGYWHPNSISVELKSLTSFKQTEEDNEYYEQYEKRAYVNDIGNETNWASQRKQEQANAEEINTYKDKWTRQRKKDKGKKTNYLRKSMTMRRLKLIALQGIQKDMSTLISDQKEHHSASQINGEWKIVAKVLDRVFFAIFLATVTGSTVCILLPVYFHDHDHDHH